MDDKPRNLRAMLAEAKDLSELMVDLAYAALYFGDPDMATEVDELEIQMTALVQDMRAVCIMAVRHPREAEGMSSVLQVISAIERIANDAVDISRIVSRRLGIPAELTCPAPRRSPTAWWYTRVPTWCAAPWATWSCRWWPGCGSWPSAGSAAGSPTLPAISC